MEDKMNKKVFGLAALSILSMGFMASCGKDTSSVTVSSPSSQEESSSEESSSSIVASTSLNLTITCPKGAPSLALVPFLHDYSSKVTITSPTEVVAGFTSATSDIIIFDISKGYNLIAKQNKNYKLAKVLTAGNVYLMSTGNDDNDVLDYTDSFVSFGTNSFFTTFFEKAHNIPATAVSEVSDVSTAMTVATTGKLEGNDVDYVMLSEPFVTTAMAKNDKLTIKEDISELVSSYSTIMGWNGGVGYSTFPMAGVFIRKDVDENAAKAGDIKYVMDNLAAASSDYSIKDGADMIKQIKTDTDAGIYDTASADTCLFGPLTLPLIEKVLNKDTAGCGKSNALGFVYGVFDYASFAKEVLGVEVASSFFSSFYVA